MREQGFAHPVVIFLLLVISVGLIAAFTYTKENYTNTERVKGVSSSILMAGFSVSIKSSDNWDFVEYLCSDLENCIKKSTISGGPSESHDLVVAFEPEWSSYNYIKVVTKPSWGTSTRAFDLNLLHPDSMATTLEDNSVTYDALIIPVSEVSNTFIDMIAEFSDKH